jgi:hypothetical protein
MADLDFLAQRYRDTGAVCKLRRPEGSCDEQEALLSIGIPGLLGIWRIPE